MAAQTTQISLPGCYAGGRSKGQACLHIGGTMRDYQALRTTGNPRLRLGRQATMLYVNASLALGVNVLT
jgi:hypothetical protein